MCLEGPVSFASFLFRERKEGALEGGGGEIYRVYGSNFSVIQHTMLHR